MSEDRENRPGSAAEESDLLDEEISEFVDGELSEERRARLLERAAREPEIAARLEAYQRLDAALRERTAPAVPADLGDRLRARIRRAQPRSSGVPSSGLASEQRRVARGRTPSRHRARPALAAAAAMAAGLALYWAAGGGEGPGLSAPEPTLARSAPVDGSADPVEIAEVELDDAPADEIAIALEFDTIADFEVIEQLEVLEMLAALAPPERG